MAIIYLVLFNQSKPVVNCIYIFVYFFNMPSQNGGGEGWPRLLLGICVTTTLGNAVPVGYFIGVMNSPAEVMRSWWREALLDDYHINMSETNLNLLWSCIVSIFQIGGIVGSLFSAWCCKNFGR